MSCHYFSLGNIFVIDQKDLKPSKMGVTGHLKIHSMVSHRLFHGHCNLKTESALGRSSEKDFFGLLKGQKNTLSKTFHRS